MRPPDPLFQRNVNGRWVGTIPLPYVQRRFQIWRLRVVETFECPRCEAVFSEEVVYRGHYALKHVMKVD